MKPLKESRNNAAPFKSLIFYWKATIFLVAFFLSIPLYAQVYGSAIGGRLAYGGLISYKHSLNPEIMAEGIFAVRWGGIELTALIERYTPAFENENMYWYYGGGMHLGLHGRNNTIDPPEDANSKTYINLGADLVGGLEYRFSNAPISASVDYIPSFFFTGDRWFVGEGVGLSLRYIIQ